MQHVVWLREVPLPLSIAAPNPGNAISIADFVTLSKKPKPIPEEDKKKLSDGPFSPINQFDPLREDYKELKVAKENVTLVTESGYICEVGDYRVTIEIA